MKTLIVSRTKASGGARRCVGGIAAIGEKYRSVRLMNPAHLYRKGDQQYRGKGFWSKGAPFQVGQLWDLDLETRKNTKPPHVEDVIVREREFIREAEDSNLRDWLRKCVGHMSPSFLWKGEPQRLFGGKLKSTKSRDGTGYAVEENVPRRSTGFWIPNRDLVLQPNGKHFKYQGDYKHRGISRLKHIGESTPPRSISRGKLVRVSLSR